MFKPVIYLEIRILLSAIPGVFKDNSDFNGAKDILTAKAEFQQKNNSATNISSVEVAASPLHKAGTLIQALGGRFNDSVAIEKLTASIPEPPDEKGFKGYSIKVGEGGSLDIMFQHKSKNIPIEEYRIEENIGHLTRSNGNPHIDWTYAGCPSLRIKTAPVFELGEEAEIFLDELFTIMTYLKLIIGGLGEATFRCNAYTALANYPLQPSYTVKLRNLNSFNFVRKAINNEISRQEELLASGKKIESESRLWIEETNSTESWQERINSPKRFEAIKPTVLVDLSAMQNSKVEMELPLQRQERFRLVYGLSRLRARFICREKDRADFFESAVKNGASPKLCARWIAGELTGILNQKNQSIKQSRLTASNFAVIMELLEQKKIHSGIAKELIARIYETGENPVDVVQNQKWFQLSSPEELEPFIQKALEENPESVSCLKSGQMSPLEHLTGAVMKLTDGRAVPTVVKSIIKEKLKISVVYVLKTNGLKTINNGNSDSTKFTKDKKNPPVQIVSVNATLNEEVEPSDLAELVAEIKNRIDSGLSRGIVVPHGLSTISYTAALLFWLFSTAEVPIILSTYSDFTESDEENFKYAIKIAQEKRNGIFMTHKCRLFSPLNLKFMSNCDDGFINLNMSQKIFRSENTISNNFMSINFPDAKVIAEIMSEAASKLEVIKTYPGFKSNRINTLINNDANLKHIILELYSGTVNMKNSDYSLKQILLNGKKHGINFYCTFQQNAKIDFSDLSKFWINNTIPMDVLTTESVVALYFASSIIADNDAELNQLMEECIEETCNN